MVGNRSARIIRFHVFRVHGIALIVDIVQTNGKTKPNTIVDRTADVEIILSYVSFLSLTIEKLIAIIEIHISIFIKAHHLFIISINTGPYHISACLTMKSSIFNSSQLALRSPIQIVGRIQNLIEISTLVIVKCQIDVATSAACRRPDNTYLIKAYMRFTSIKINSRIIELCIVLCVSLRHYTRRKAYLILSEQTDTSRVRADGRNICTEGFHGATHTYITCSTIQTVLCQFSILVSFLSQGWGCHESQRS